MRRSSLQVGFFHLLSGLALWGCGGGSTATPCDTTNPTACASGFVCRPAAGGGAYCEPETTVGRIPGCIDSEGLDVFAVEANHALSVSWNVNSTSIDTSGGFNVRWGTATGTYANEAAVAADARDTVISGLDNNVTYYVVVEALNGGGGVSFTSCEVNAVPHVLVFGAELMPASLAGTNQTNPAMASNLEGNRIFLAWEEEGSIAAAVSTDFGDSWTLLGLTGATGNSPSIAVREAVIDPQNGNVLEPETVFLSWESGGTVMLVRYLSVDGVFEEAAYAVGTGTQPAVAVGPNAVHIAYLDAGAIYHIRSIDRGATFLTPIGVSGTTTMPSDPAIDVNQQTGDVYISWHAFLGQGNTDIYIATSLDEGVSFGGTDRVDDDTGGYNQLIVSLAVDERTDRVYATWEDRRGGSNVYFSWSDDHGVTWAANVNVGAGLGGDQFRPRAVVDIARNVYVIFTDTTNGQQPVFSRFNADGAFDPPLAPSSAAGAGGVVGDNACVATDRYGAVYTAWQENRNGPTNQVFFNRAE